MANFTPDLKPYTGQGKFRYWVQMVLPTIYDDSLSYMELLNKVVYALNLAIEDVTAVEDNVESLLNAFNELQQFTNDYFDNLDVQEEIDKKLDEMATTGALEPIVDPIISVRVTQWLENNITPTTPIVDKTLSISGAAADAEIIGDLVKPIIEKSYNIITPFYINANIIQGEIVPITTGNNNFAQEEFIAIPDGENNITLSGTPNRGNTTIYIHEYTTDSVEGWIGYQSKKVNNFPATVTLGDTTRFIRINGYLAGGSYITAIPNDFMITLGTARKFYEPPYILNGKFASEYAKNYKQVRPELANTHSTRMEYSTVYCCTPNDRKILLTDEIILYAPAGLRIAYQVYEGQFDQLSDRIHDSGWLYSPVRIPSEYKGKYIRLVLAYNPATLITPEVAEDIQMYIKNGTTAELLDKYNDLTNIDVIDNINGVYKSIAHRGLSKISPECTAISYINAKRAGFRYAENDLTITSDGVYVMWHDQTLNKLGQLVSLEGYAIYKESITDYILYYDSTNNKYYRHIEEGYVEYTPVNEIARINGYDIKITETTYELLKTIDFGRYKGGEYIGTKILTFEDFVLLCRDLGLYIYLDRKIKYTQENLPQIVEIINKYGMQTKTYFVGGFTPTTIQNLFQAAPYIKAFVSLALPTEENINNFENYGATPDKLIFMPDGKTITEPEGQIIRAANGKGYETQAYYVDYTLNKTDLIQTLYNISKYGVNAFTTDNYTFADIVK